MKMKARNIFSASIIKTVTHTEVHGRTSTTHLSRWRRTQTTNLFILPRTCSRWKTKPTICFIDTASSIMMETSTAPSTSSTQTLQMDLVAAGWSRKVSTYILQKQSYRVTNFLFNTGKTDANAGINEGTWDATHLVTTTIDGQNKVKYRLNSTIFLFIQSTGDVYGALNVGG